MAFPPHMGGFNAARFPTVNQNWAGFQGNVPQFIPTMNVRQQFRPVFPPPPHVQMMSPGMAPMYPRPGLTATRIMPSPSQRFAPPEKLVVHTVPVPPPPAVTYQNMRELPACRDEEIKMMSCSFRLPQDLKAENLHPIDLLHTGGPVRLTIYCDPKSEPVKAFWFPYGFNQNVINGRFKDDGTLTSNACTLIAVLQACNIELTDHRIRYFGEPPEEHKGTVALFMATMGEANRIHLDMLRAGTLDENRLNITIPEACGVVQPNQKILSELFYAQGNLSGKRFSTAFFHGINQAIKRFHTTFPVPHTPRNLYLVIIVDQRSMVLVHQMDTGLMTFFDSHCHVPHGAVMAQVKEGDLMAFCRWYEEVCQRVYNAAPYRFEISCMVSSACATASQLGLDIGQLHPKYKSVKKGSNLSSSPRSSTCSSLSTSPVGSPPHQPSQAAASAGASRSPTIIVRLPSPAPDGTNAAVYRTVIPIGSLEEQEGRLVEPGDRVDVTIVKGQCCCSKVRKRRHSYH